MSDSPRDSLEPLVGEIRDRVLTLLGEPNVRSMFITGSVARDEIACAPVDNVLEVYSDLDVAVVVGDDLDIDAARGALRRLADDFTHDRNGIRCCASPDIGLYAAGAYGQQPVRPGTVGIPQSHVLLYGDAETPLSFDPAPESIDPSEALYLIENRLNELATVIASRAEAGEGSATRYAHYLALKGAIDTATAVLVATGRHAVSRAERIRRFLSDEFTEERAALLGDESCGWVEQCARELEDMSHVVEGGAARVREAVARTQDALFDAWRHIAARHYNVEPANTADLFLARCEAGRRLSHLRQGFTLASRIGRRPASSLRAAVAASAWSIMSMLPLAALRLAATVEMQPKAAEDHAAVVRYLDVLTEAFGYEGETVFHRARAMYGDAIR